MNASSLPEILLDVFKLIKQSSCRREWFANLITLTQVCRAWRPIAEETFYRAIYIEEETFNQKLTFFYPPSLPSSPSDDEKKLLFHDRIALLARTLREREDLASVVRILKVGSTDNQPAKQKCLEIITLCPKLLVLGVPKYGGYDVDALRETIAQKTHLRVLALVCGRGNNIPAVGDAKGFIHLMQCLPNIEDVTYDDFFENFRATDDKPPPLASLPVLHSVLPLQRIKLSAALPLSDEGFSLLATLSLPHLKSFSVTVQFSPNDNSNAVADCIGTWSSHLMELEFFDMDAGVIERERLWPGRQNLSSVLKRMECLMHLTISWCFILPHDILFLEGLTHLEYYSLIQGDANFLASQLKETKRLAAGDTKLLYLPKLKKLSFDMSDNLHDERQMMETCKARGIDFDTMVWGGLSHPNDFPWELINNPDPDDF